MEHDYISKRESEDIDARLPSPMRNEHSEESENTNSSGDEQNDNIEREGSEGIMTQPRIPINEKAYLTHEEALISVFEKELVSKDFLNNWNNEDLMGVLVQLTKYNTDEEGVKKIARHFKDTSPEEVFLIRL